MSIAVPIIILILGVPIYALCKWVLNKWNWGNEKNRSYLAIIPTAILSPLVYIGLIYIWLFSASYYPSITFDEQVWKSNPEKRYKMSENIIESQILIGKTRQDIVELLGTDFYTYSDNHVAYGLGFVPGLFNIDPDVLDIYFKNGKVIRVGQHET